MKSLTHFKELKCPSVKKKVSIGINLNTNSAELPT
nr:MAG TPA: hypothetical protein [Caudoviricetes sp.]